MSDLARFSINQMTVKQLSLPELTAACRDLGVGNVGLWREPVQAYGVEAAAKLVRDAGLTVTTLCRGGFLTATDPDARARALADNRRAVDEAATLGTDTLVLVSGGLPPGDKDLRAARERIADALAELGPYAEEHGVRLAIEPLHPMYASDRCVVSTLTQALDLAERFPAHQVGVTVDTYHIWWDDRAPEQIARAGAGGRIHTFQLADWTTPLPEGVLNGRGQIGDGAIDMREWQGYVEAAGYTGAIEVELFNEGLWARDGREVLAETAQRFAAHVAPTGTGK
ncbi:MULTISPECIES: sugar phosphate isomerase/epimerase family protein [Streptomyces]|uniref:Sugar phosphate isomerase/epimerase n=2 Tax=Streptomyces rochei group TaxID=2867164 RepID=A0AAX3ZGY5_STRRO|nr:MULTISPECIES: sugar phosphate isomerase/epimerase family protein [Streptomyces]WDI18510.1 sugar phosphate isomerase/epimerase [Streptomyces enissocaesilis]KYK09475.1 sugar phosphate isomerase [Streptomyces sp. CC71]MBQ0911915.1 sugar phosphate isomerase/epimerase [Streptomyces sp. RM99]MCC8449388.1 sugar phosphate isomerase/epimerase [Streptomyces rochei]MDI3096309.1 sugar phosphate isomerase/epimerase family protein [Streptomyces sp. AN-3]